MPRQGPVVLPQQAASAGRTTPMRNAVGIGIGAVVGGAIGLYGATYLAFTLMGDGQAAFAGICAAGRSAFSSAG